MAKKFNPLVSFVISTNKYDKYFDSSIQSILNQTYHNIEIILVVENNYNFFKKKMQLMLKKSKVVCKVIKANIPGFGHCLNLGIENAEGEFVARMDCDDLSHPNRILYQIKFFLKNPKYSIVGTKALLINEKGKKILGKELAYFKDDHTIKKVLPYRNPIIHPSVVIKKELFIKYGAYKYDFFSQDYELWVRYSLNEKIKFYNINKKLYYYRIHPKQSISAMNIHASSYDISGFLFKYFLLTKNIKFILGIIIASPFIRKIKIKILQKIKLHI
jgi:glycosyltransferase involved in cell wall biosynthesis